MSIAVGICYTFVDRSVMIAVIMWNTIMPTVSDTVRNHRLE